MASISNLALRLTRDIGNVLVQVDYDINWDSFDRNSDQTYLEFTRIIGDDSGIIPPEDGTDDLIGLLIFSLQVPVSSNGQTTTHRTFRRTVERAILDEDPGAALDEIRAQVTLTPQLPAVVDVQSNPPMPLP